MSQREARKRQDEKHLRILKKMIEGEEGNRFCADCNHKGPRWASWNLGVFICMRCAGIHRNLGVHISKVKSTTLDSWTPEQIQSFSQKGGNTAVNAVYEAGLPPNFGRPRSDHDANRFIRDKYESRRFMRGENGGITSRQEERSFRVDNQSRYKNARSASGDWDNRYSNSSFRPSYDKQMHHSTSHYTKDNSRSISSSSSSSRNYSSNNNRYSDDLPYRSARQNASMQLQQPISARNRNLHVENPKVNVEDDFDDFVSAGYGNKVGSGCDNMINGDNIPKLNGPNTRNSNNKNGITNTNSECTDNGDGSFLENDIYIDDDDNQSTTQNTNSNDLADLFGQVENNTNVTGGVESKTTQKPVTSKQNILDLFGNVSKDEQQINDKPHINASSHSAFNASQGIGNAPMNTFGMTGSASMNLKQQQALLRSRLIGSNIENANISAMNKSSKIVDSKKEDSFNHLMAGFDKMTFKSRNGNHKKEVSIPSKSEQAQVPTADLFMF